MVREAPQVLGEPLASLIKGKESKFENIVRYRAVSARLIEARERLGISVKQISARLKLPQYRIRAIECGSLSAIRPGDLRRYIDALGLRLWYRRWAKANRRLADQLGGKEGI